MRKIKAQTIYHLIQNACKEKGTPFTKRGYRAAKIAYNQIPRPRRHLVTSYP